MRFRIPLVALLLLVVPQVSKADYIDVITDKLNPDCTMEKYLANIAEFRSVMTAQGYTYTVEIMAPVTGDDLGVVFWVGRTKDFATFAAEYSKWLAALETAGSPEAKLNEKLTRCSTNLSRSGLLTQ
jgi:hypothetical protein